MAPAPTVLGLPGAWAEDPLEASSHYTTKVGGVPCWPSGVEAILSDERLACRACGRRLGLVVQAYAPLFLKGRDIAERTLYVFGCLSSNCGYDPLSWRVFRVQGEDSGIKSAEPAEASSAVDTVNSAGSTAAVGSDSWWQDDSWGAAPSERADARAGNNEMEAESRSETLVASTEGPDASRLTSAESDPLRLGDSKASGSSGAKDQETVQDGRKGETDVRAGSSDIRSEDAPTADDWGDSDNSWGGGAASEWNADGTALDMSALSEAIAEAADGASKRTEKPRGDDVSGTRVTSASLAAHGGDERARSGAGASVLPCFYIVAGEEAPEKRRKEAEVSRLVTESPGEESWEGEGYEYDSARSADRTFLRFRKRVERAPEQCIRYGFQSQPLLARALSAPPPPCPACGAPRTFEMQLMPPLPYFLAEASEEAAGQVAGWEWLTLLVYTCSEACTKPEKSGGHVAVQEEFHVYQHELDSVRGQPQVVK